MISKDHPSRPQAVAEFRENARRGDDASIDTTIVERLNLKHLALEEGLEQPYDPYNTGAFRVLAERAPRRTLDDMRQLDAEIRRVRKPWE